MSATGRNIMKVILGSALGAAIAAGVNHLARRQDIPPEQRVPLTEEIKGVPVRVRERWERAALAGDAAAAAEEARLRQLFREKVDDPTALTPPQSPSR
ncbi:MAG TPA: hypothetical protein VKZ96_05005 [Thermomicrobiales bacterium]|nr:hypothetical protein [Thermomicrobiales bacterium]